MIVSAALILLLAAAAAGIGIAARALGRPMPGAYLAGFFLLACLPFPRAFVSDVTVLPLDHAAYTTPWISPGRGAPYNPYLNDVATQILPWAKETRLALKEGALPLRDRWNGCGMPLAANSVSAAFSPWTWLGLLLPLARGFTLIVALKLLLAASGMFLWTRELGTSERAAAFAGTVYGLAFCFTPPWLFFPQSSVLSLWPWTLFLVERLGDERGRRRTVAALTVLFAVTALAGHPETAATGFLFVGLWLALRLLTGNLPRPGRIFSGIAVAAAVAVGLTAFLLVPSLHAIAASGRLADAERPFWQPLLSLAPHPPLMRALPTPLFPYALGNGIGSPVLPGATGSVPEMGLGYFGIVGWAAALLILRPGSRRRPETWILAGLLVCGWAIAVAAWPAAEIFSHTPVLRYLFPPRFHAWEALAGPAIAALELDRLARDAADRRRAALAALLPPAALALLAILVYRHFRPEHAAAGGLAFQTRRLALALAVLAATAALLLVLRRRPGPALAALTVLAGAELLVQWRGLFLLYSPALLFPETPMIRFLRAQPGPFRVVGEGPALFPSTNVFAGLEDIRTHDATERKDYLAFLDATCGYKYEYFKKIRNVDASALDFLNVRYVVTGPDGRTPGARWRPAYAGVDGRAFENGGALPRAFAPARVRRVAAATRAAEPVADANAAFGGKFREIAALDRWRETAYVLADGEGETANAAVDVSDYRESTNAAAFRARVSGSSPGVVVLSLVQDGGWSARDSSHHAVPLLRANGPFLAVALPPGSHEIELRYSPPGFSTGTRISAVTAAGALAFAGISARRRRRRRAPG